LKRQASYSKTELLQHGFGKLPGQSAARLPTPPILMFDRITGISAEGGAHGRGAVVAEKDVAVDDWFFFTQAGDPMMPGCLGIDALWQLGGFFLAWSGFPGQGRALGCAEVKLEGEVRPHDKLVRYEVSVRRVITSPTPLLLADGTVSVDGKEICWTRDLKVGCYDLPYSWP
jgi:3-hydroxyacyl-[acyl-carrier protein] dehydratase/trans-2-decenoyl-[acyl-carrier protein] isomerase